MSELLYHPPGQFYIPKPFIILLFVLFSYHGNIGGIYLLSNWIHVIFSCHSNMKLEQKKTKILRNLLAYKVSAFSKSGCYGNELRLICIVKTKYKQQNMYFI